MLRVWSAAGNGEQDRLAAVTTTTGAEWTPGLVGTRSTPMRKSRTMPNVKFTKYRNNSHLSGPIKRKLKKEGLENRDRCGS